MGFLYKLFCYPDFPTALSAFQSDNIYNFVSGGYFSMTFSFPSCDFIGQSITDNVAAANGYFTMTNFLSFDSSTYSLIVVGCLCLFALGYGTRIVVDLMRMTED